MTQLIKNIYETGEWLKDFIEVTTTAFKKKPKATKCSDHRTISLIAHRAKMAARIHSRKIESKIEDVIGENQFGFRRGKGTGMLRRISERSLEKKIRKCVFVS
jgi:hypothetical protein